MTGEKMEAPRGSAILSVDTSLPMLSVGLMRGEDVLGGITLAGKESRNEKLLPSVDWLLAETGVDRASLGLLVVTRGPGSFTGVRVGLATIQGLSFALGIPVCAMSTHEAFAESVRQAASVLVHGDGGRGEFYVSGFAGDQERLEPGLMTRAEFDAVRQEYDAEIDIEKSLPETNLALLAARRASRILVGGLDHRYRSTTPIYVRLAEAEVKLRQKADEQSGG